MIEAKIFINPVGNISGFSVSGHSGQAEHGQDIVCAGVSALTQTALFGIGKHLHRKVKFEIASGKLEVKLEGEPDDLTEAILRTMYIGLLEIAKLSPNRINIKEARR